MAAEQKQEKGFDLLGLLGLSGGDGSAGGLTGLLKQLGIFDMLAGIPILGPMLVASLEQQAAPDPQVAAAAAQNSEKAASQLKIIYNALGNQTSPEVEAARKNITTALESLGKGELKLTDGFNASAPPPSINSKEGLAKTVNAAFAGGFNQHTLALILPLAIPALELAGKDDAPPQTTPPKKPESAEPAKHQTNPHTAIAQIEQKQQALINNYLGQTSAMVKKEIEGKLDVKQMRDPAYLAQVEEATKGYADFLPPNTQQTLTAFKALETERQSLLSSSTPIIQTADAAQSDPPKI